MHLQTMRHSTIQLQPDQTVIFKIKCYNFGFDVTLKLLVLEPELLTFMCSYAR